MNNKYTCLHCGACCRIRGFVRVTPEEIDRMASLLGIPPHDFIERYTRLAQDRSGLELAEKENGKCVLLAGNDCLVQQVKPRQCRTFPDEWRYPGVEEICKAYMKSITPNS
ncbi:MAG: YkgJ family cysteine cluster protein [Candidatus Aureabacteria bacterium]|nr:YkgJ family cysteine cluster protein [Candidatus Auribacterota bacterium]